MIIRDRRSVSDNRNSSIDLLILLIELLLVEEEEFALLLSKLVIFSFGSYFQPKLIGTPELTLGLSPNVVSYVRTCECEKDTFLTKLNSSFLLLPDLLLLLKPFVDDLLRLNIDIFEFDELRHDFNVKSVEERCNIGVEAAHLLNLAFWSRFSGISISSFGRSRSDRPIAVVLAFGVERCKFHPALIPPF